MRRARTPSARPTCPPGEGQRTFERLVLLETDKCVLWPWGLNHYGYGQVWLGRRNLLTHIVACERHHGPRPPGHEVGHGRPDGTPCVSRACMNYRHLRWTTSAENTADMKSHGRTSGGTRRLAVADVIAIREAHASGTPFLDLVERYPIGPAAMQLLLSRRTWRNVP